MDLTAIALVDEVCACMLVPVQINTALRRLRLYGKNSLRSSGEYLALRTLPGHVDTYKGHHAGAGLLHCSARVEDIAGV